MENKKLPISVFIIAKDEADRISRPILSTIDWVDEVIVVDSGSTDNTVELSRELGAKVMYNPWKGYGPQRVYAEQQCHNKWILMLDADEEIDDTLRESIIKEFENGEPKYKVYDLTLILIFRFSLKPPILARKQHFYRLYHIDYAGSQSTTVHDLIVPKDKSTPVGKLKGIILHRAHRSFEHWLYKINFYTSMQGEYAVKNKKKKPSAFKVLIAMPLYFFKAYILRRYFIYGINGYIYSKVYAFSRLLKYAKEREVFEEVEFNKKNELGK